MKTKLAPLMVKACSFCLACSGIFHWKGISIFLFGEQKFPDPADYEK